MNNQIGFSELDQSLLDSQMQYNEYHTYLPKYLDHVIEYLPILVEATFLSEKHEFAALEMAIKQLKETVLSLKFKYLFDPKNALRVDVTHSGFPNYFEIHALEKDFENVDKQTAPERALIAKREMLDFMMQQKKVSTKIQQLISRYTYMSMLNYDSVFKIFNPSLQVFALEHKKEYVKYFVSWSCYTTASNRPQVYLMEFEYHNKGNSIYDHENDLDDLYTKLLSTNWKTQAPLQNIVSHIDLLCPNIKPKLLKRVDIGPYYTVFKKDESVFAQILRSFDSFKDNIMCMTIESIESISEVKSNGGISEVLQVFNIPSEIEECQERKCSSIDRFIFTTHTISQILYSLYKKNVVDKLTLPPIIINT